MLVWVKKNGGILEREGRRGEGVDSGEQWWKIEADIRQGRDKGRDELEGRSRTEDKSKVDSRDKIEDKRQGGR